MSKFGYRVALALVIGLAGCTPAATLVIPAPLPQATATPTPTVIPTATAAPTPAPTATPAPFPTPDPRALAGIAREGLAGLQAAAGDANLVCFRHEDLDDDGAPEWLALLHQPQVERMSAFVLDDALIIDLPDAKPDPGKPYYGLGQYATCEVEIRDVNADGRTEIAIFGHAAANKTLLHLYVWEDNTYRLLGAFQGDAGVFFADADGDLAEEIIEGYQDAGAPDLAWRVIFTWDGQTYGWTSDRWSWFFLERPHAYITHKPEYALTSFYLALDDRDLPGAYELLLTEVQAEQPYASWALGFATTLRVDVGSVQRLGGGDDTHARVSALVMAWDNDGGRIVVRLWDVEWALTLTGAGWRLGNGTAELLDSWEVRHWE
ncbi:MAG: hypothetical protein JXB35_09800 [Anaerolineae bacterium]|nr:hypothetical protein [Anaerolineae bacterium]